MSGSWPSASGKPSSEPRRIRLRLFLSLLLCAAWVSPGAGEPPRLILFLIADQYRADYLDRFGDLYRGALRRLSTTGARFTDAHVGQAPTMTAPSHAILLSGTYARDHGIVANAWYDRASGSRIGAVEDPAHRLLDDPFDRSGVSPHRLLTPTLGDLLRQRFPNSRIVAISGKDRSAVPSAGHRGLAYWWDRKSSRMATSSYYAPSLPSWVRAFNDRRPAGRHLGTVWDRLLSAPEYRRARPAPRGAIRDWHGLGLAFPHSLSTHRPGFSRAFQATPFADELLLEFAREAMIAERLGQGSSPDLLVVSLSAIDLIGHLFGPDSEEIMDAVLRLDRNLDMFLRFVDHQVGLDQTLVIFTSDHGVAPIPEQAGRAAGRILTRAFLASLRLTLRERLGPGHWVEAWTPPYLYLNERLARARGMAASRLTRSAAAIVESFPGVARAYTRDELTHASAHDPWQRALALGAHADRVGDVTVLVQPYWLLTRFATGTNHGSPYSYDSHVPLILAGPGVRPGTYSKPVTLADVAPTVAGLVGLPFPRGRAGKARMEVVKTPHH